MSFPAHCFAGVSETAQYNTWVLPELTRLSRFCQVASTIFPRFFPPPRQARQKAGEAGFVMFHQRVKRFNDFGCIFAGGIEL
jgi:hypothetical protein